MSSWAPKAEPLIALPKGLGQNERTRIRVQVIPLCICVVASMAFVASTNLPWFGDLSNDNPSPQFSALSASGLYTPPGSPVGLGPGTQNWGHLSVWDAAMLTKTLREAGFAEAQQSNYREGRNPELLLDQPERRWETLYVEAVR